MATTVHKNDVLLRFIWESVTDYFDFLNSVDSGRGECTCALAASTDPQRLPKGSPLLKRAEPGQGEELPKSARNISYSE